MLKNPPLTPFYWKTIEDVATQMPELVGLWLTDTGSLTKRLRQIGNNQLRHHIRAQKWDLPTLEEAQRLEVTVDEPLFIRETDWCYQQELWVSTRALMPQTTLENPGQGLQTIGERSLGDLLFSDPSLQRSPFEFASLGQTVWARRSIFFYFGKPLLVTEIFFAPVLNRKPPANA